MPNELLNEPIENKKYSIWNNKGGVGKTALTFLIATEYAYAHPEKEVVVIDVCPQANISEILLGGHKDGNENLEKMIKSGKTIGSYLRKRIESKPFEKTGDESSYAVQLSQYNESLPENLHLVAGDPILERLVDSMTGLARQDMPTDSWKRVHSYILDLTDGIMLNKASNAVFFIDCNPSFAIYTKQALIASKRLIVPCTADGSSARGIDNVASLLYGVNNEYDKFFKQMNEYGMPIPLIHLVPLNQSTQYDKSAANVFSAMYKAVKDKVENLKKEKIFSTQGKNDTFFDVRDMHSTFRTINYFGHPLHNFKTGNYVVHGEKVQINKDQLTQAQQCIQDLIKMV